MVCPLQRTYLALTAAVIFHARAGQLPDAHDAVENHISLLQMNFKGQGQGLAPGVAPGSLAMAYIPYNFGHTVADVAMRTGIKWGDCGSRTGLAGCIGHSISPATGCSLMYTPGKYWPKEIASEYFGNRTIFGILRDPYERMVAQFRGSGALDCPDLHRTCDLNAAIKRKLNKYLRALEAGQPFSNNCQELPQAEYFDQPFGITVPVDNRRFPESANEVLQAHGYKDVYIRHEDVAHVSGCDHVWAGDLDPEARALIKQVYARDFELLCTHFGYCDKEESMCLTHIQGMCPEQLFRWESSQQVYVRIPPLR